VAEGHGEAGAAMKQSHHSIPLSAPQSLVARAARQGKIITVENVRDDPNWLPNPLLPDTNAEMAVPIMLNQEIAGVLDVQSEKIGGLTQNDESTLLLLANQIATAVRNARLFTETQSALAEAQRLQQIYTGQAWEEINMARSLDYEFQQMNMPTLAGEVPPEAALALQQKQTVQLRLPPTYKDTVENEQSALATPLKLRDQVIGILGIHSDDPYRQWSRDEIALIETVSEQMSLALENARLFEDSQRSAWRDQTISESTAKVWSSTELEEILRAAVAQLGDKLRASEVVIRLGAEETLLNEPEIV
jgi:GAF domain-containing protein